jgi:hypothetical protein
MTGQIVNYAGTKSGTRFYDCESQADLPPFAPDSLAWIRSPDQPITGSTDILIPVSV